MSSIEKSLNYTGQFSEDYKVFFVWLGLESTILIAALLANALYLLTRSFCRQNTTLNLQNSVCHVESDILEARQIEIGLISSWMTPLVATFCIFLMSLFPLGAELEPKIEQLSNYLRFLMIVESLQVLIGLSFFFVHMMEGWQCNTECWI